MDADPGTLSDLNVLELGHVVAAPHASLVLADLGADVVKIERPDRGDHMRDAGDMGEAIFAALNRDKRSVGLDLKDDDDRVVFRELASKTDVLIENFSPGTMENLNVGYETLQEVNPELVYVSIKGYEPDGPYGTRPATDPIIQAMTGLMNLTGHPDGAPSRAGTSVVDFATAMNAVVATLLALRERRETGSGRRITVPMFRSGITLMSYWLAYRQLFDREPERMGGSHPLYVPYNVFPARDDRHLFVGVTNDAQWRRLGERLGLSLAYDGHGERLANRDAINEAIAEATRTWERDELVAELLEEDIPTAPLNDIADVLADPHLGETGGLVEVPANDATGDPLRLPPAVAGWPTRTDSDGVPTLGAGTREVLDECGVWDDAGEADE